MNVPQGRRAEQGTSVPVRRDHRTRRWRSAGAVDNVITTMREDTLYRRALRDIAEAAVDADSPGVAWARIMGVLQEVVGFDTGLIGACGGTAATSQAVFLGHEEAALRRNIGPYLAALTPDEIAQYVDCTRCSSAVFSTRRREELAIHYSAMAPRVAKHMIHRVKWSRGELIGFNLERGGCSSDFGDAELDFMDAVFPLLQIVNLLGKEGARESPDFVAQWSLTKREAEIANLVTRGLQNSEIAQLLGLSRNTVRNALARVFEKAQVSTRSELVFLAHQLRVQIMESLSSPEAEGVLEYANKVRMLSVHRAAAPPFDRSGDPIVHRLVSLPRVRQA
jgi:DNA-binding CsgD family transcriptional regulator